MLLKKRFVTALLVGAIGVSLCVTGAMAARTKDFVPIEEVWTEDTGILIYCSYYNDPEKVALDSNGKPLAVGISKAAIARTKGEYVKSSKDPMAWWQEGFSEDGFKQVAGSESNYFSLYSFAIAPDGTVYYRDDNNGRILTILHPDGTTETIGETQSGLLAMAPDGKVWFYGGDGDLACYDPITGNVEYVAGTTPQFKIAVAPDGKVWFTDLNNYSYDLTCYDPATGNKNVVWANARYATVAPDGKVWFKDYNNSGNLAYYDPVTGYKKSFCGTVGSYYPTIAPDGKVWSSDRNHSYNLVSYDPTTGNLKYVAGTSVAYSPAIAPDGKVWFMDRNHSDNLAVYNPATGNIKYFPETYDTRGVHIDDAGNVWFKDGNNNLALTVYSPEKDQTRDW